MRHIFQIYKKLVQIPKVQYNNTQDSEHAKFHKEYFKNKIVTDK